jgi:hypothetical protein
MPAYPLAPPTQHLAWQSQATVEHRELAHRSLERDLTVLVRVLGQAPLSLTILPGTSAQPAIGAGAPSGQKWLELAQGVFHGVRSMTPEESQTYREFRDRLFRRE